MTRGGIASDPPTAGTRPGEGVSDPTELTRLIEILRRSEEASRSRPDVRIGEFLVDGVRVPLPFLAGLQGLTRTEAIRDNPAVQSVQTEDDHLHVQYH